MKRAALAGEDSMPEEIRGRRDALLFIVIYQVRPCAESPVRILTNPGAAGVRFVDKGLSRTGQEGEITDRDGGLP